MDINGLHIRSEMPGDEGEIDNVNCLAFGQMDEAHLVRLIRLYYPEFDHRYSVTAWYKDRLVGHALFSPARIRLMGKTISALAVAPVAVIPELQGRGIGGHLLSYGHNQGKRDGFALTFLRGHPTYYRRFGYQPCFGSCGIHIDPEKLPEPTQCLRPYPVRPADIPWLMEQFAAEWCDVDFCWQRGTSLRDWSMLGVNAIIWWTEFGRRAAYTLGWPGRRGWQMVLADEPLLARSALAMIKPKLLRQHPAGWLARNVLSPEWSKAREMRIEESAMACELKLGVLKPYRKAVESGERLPGCCSWPLPFMTC